MPFTHDTLGNRLPETVKQKEEPPILLTQAQAAKIINCAPRTLEQDRIRRRWKIPYVKIGAMIRYRQSDLEKYINKSTVQD
jgi:hypothetical protein